MATNGRARGMLACLLLIAWRAPAGADEPATPPVPAPPAPRVAAREAIVLPADGAAAPRQSNALRAAAETLRYSPWARQIEAAAILLRGAPRGPVVGEALRALNHFGAPVALGPSDRHGAPVVLGVQIWTGPATVLPELGFDPADLAADPARSADGAALALLLKPESPAWNTLHEARRQGQLRLLCEPRLATLSGRPAQIDLGGAGATWLEITPRVGDDQRLRLELRAVVALAPARVDVEADEQPLAPFQRARLRAEVELGARQAALLVAVPKDGSTQHASRARDGEVENASNNGDTAENRAASGDSAAAKQVILFVVGPAAHVFDGPNQAASTPTPRAPEGQNPVRR